MNSEPRTIVLGVGNVLHCDDGLGIHAIERLRRHPLVPRSALLLDGGTFGIELLTYIADSTHLLVLDAVDVGAQPGTLIRMEGRALRGLGGAASVHQIGLADLLATLPLVSSAQPQIVLIGAQPGSTDWGVSLSPEVQPRLDAVVHAAIEQLNLWADRQRRDLTQYPADAAWVSSS